MKEEKKKSIKIGIYSAIGGSILTMIIGFAWGGWVLGGTSLETGQAMAKEAIVERLTPVCVAQFELDTEKEKKMKELLEKGTWYQTDYVKEQGWATMPFEREPDDSIAKQCALLIAKMGQ